VHLDRKALAPYFASGVKKVIVSAPVKDVDPMLNIVVGCNEVRRGGIRLGSVDLRASEWLLRTRCLDRSCARNSQQGFI